MNETSLLYITIQNDMGLHARPSAQLAELAGQFKSDISVALRGETVNAKSMIGLMTLAAEPGETLAISISGEDHDEAWEAFQQASVGI